jgi:hypothetical protein
MMAVVVNEQQADEIIAQYRADDPEFWQKLRIRHEYWVKLGDKNLPTPEEISTRELRDLAIENYIRLMEFCRKIHVFGDVEPGEEPRGDVGDTCRFVKERIEDLLHAEAKRKLKNL